MRLYGVVLKYKGITFTYVLYVIVHLIIPLNDKAFCMQQMSPSDVNPLRMKNLNSYSYALCTVAMFYSAVD